jgi:small subunit ribosomal protein S17
MSDTEKTIISRTGKVVSNKMNKTIVVAVDRMFEHPVYKKRIRRTTKYFVHDENNEAKIGDLVEFVDCRPISKNCHWRLTQIVEKAPESEVRK